MPHVLNASAQVTCSHQGTVQVLPGQQAATAGGQPVLIAGDLDGKPVAGCTLAPSPSTTPCTATVAVLVGVAVTLSVGGRPALLDTAYGLTNSVPPGTFTVRTPGQTVLAAN